MAKQSWLSKQESARRPLLNNLADKLPGTYANKYGITPDELTLLNNFRLWYNWTFDTLEAIRQKAQGYTGFRDALGYGKGTATGVLTLPPALALAATPTTARDPSCHHARAHHPAGQRLEVHRQPRQPHQRPRRLRRD